MTEHDAPPNGAPPLRSRRWFNNPDDPAMTALYVERYLNFGLTREEIQGGRPIIGIAQTGSDLSPCNRHLMDLAEPHPRRHPGRPAACRWNSRSIRSRKPASVPTAALDRNLAYLSLVEVLHGYPHRRCGAHHRLRQDDSRLPDGGGDGEHPNAIVMSGGPMLDGWWKRQARGVRHDRVGGPQALRGRKDHLRRIHGHGVFVSSIGRALQHDGHREFDEFAGRGARHVAARLRHDPRAVPRARTDGVHDTGKRIVDMVHENLRPSDIMTKAAFDNAVVAAAALGASSNCPVHMVAIARHMGVEHTLEDWHRLGPSDPAAGGLPAGRPLSR